MTSPDRLLEELRAPLAGTDELHLNNAGVAPMSRRALGAGARALEIMLRGTSGIPDLLKEIRAAREIHARLVGCDRDDLSFFPTCAAAISQVALGFPFKGGDEIVLLDQEYPSNAYPWHRAAARAGARVVVVPSAPDFTVDFTRLLEAIGERTRVVAVSWVQFSTGTTLDLRALADAAHARGAWLVVDAIQGLGVMPFDLAASGADAVCGGSHKWLLGPVGHGFLALAPGRAAALEPIMVGAMTYGTPDDPIDPARPPREDARRFEPGTPLAVGAIATAASIDLLLEIGVDRVNREALAAADLFAARADERGLGVRGAAATAGGAPRSPILTLLPRARDPKAIVDELRARGCSVAPRGGGVRVAPHAHNGPQHVERFFELWDALDR
jgi:cysteine desulfurase / selenocysteine lyase